MIIERNGSSVMASQQVTEGKRHAEYSLYHRDCEKSSEDYPLCVFLFADLKAFERRLTEYVQCLGPQTGKWRRKFVKIELSFKVHFRSIFKVKYSLRWSKVR